VTSRSPMAMNQGPPPYESETEPFALDELERARDRLARAREEP